MAIVKFRSKAAGDIIMFKSNAEDLFKVMGKSLGERGVIEAQDLPEAIAQLSAAVIAEKMAQAEKPPLSEDEEKAQPTGMEAPVNFYQRATPLLNMMQAAAKKGVDVHWGF